MGPSLLTIAPAATSCLGQSNRDRSTISPAIISSYARPVMARKVLRSLYKKTPRQLQMRLLVRRRTPMWLNRGILFIHIPRAAGTSINQALYGRFMGHPKAAEIRRWGSAPLNALPSFAITRNPWERLVSSYRFARRGGGAGGAFEAGILQPDQYRVAEFDSFERFVKEWLLRHNPVILDGIFQPQSTFVAGADGQLLVDHVGRLNDLEPTLDFIEHALGYRPEIPRGNRSGEWIDFRQFYTPELIGHVGSFYADDVERFGYSFED
jgi:hypothetical protein